MAQAGCGIEPASGSGQIGRDAQAAGDPPASGRRVPWYGLTLGAPMLLWQVLFFAFPLLFLIALSFWQVRNFRLEPAFESANWTRVLGSEAFWLSYARTWAYSALATVIASVMAFPASYGIAFKLGRNLQRFAIFLLVIPFFTSYLVRVYSWQVFLTDAGIINVLLARLGIGPLPLINTLFGTLVGYLTLVLPLVILLQLFSLMFVDRSLIEAAHNMRCGRLLTVFAVVIPSARVGLVIAALFCFILTFGDFVSPLYLGGGQDATLAILITDTTKSGQQWPRAAVIALMMVVTLLAVAFAATGYAYRRPGK